jgi:hypothetical protein
MIRYMTTNKYGIQYSNKIIIINSLGTWNKFVFMLPLHNDEQRSLMLSRVTELNPKWKHLIFEACAINSIYCIYFTISDLKLYILQY